MSELIQTYKSKVLLAHTIEERNEAGVPKLRLLPGQKLETMDGKEEDGDINMMIQCESIPRERNPIGTVFKIVIIEKRISSSGNEYYTNAGRTMLKIHEK